MRVFLTGATGFIGSAIVPELINAGLGTYKFSFGSIATSHRKRRVEMPGLRYG